LRNDPNEMTDLSTRSKHAARVKRLFARLLELQKQTGDTLDLKRVYPDLI
jgi:hypothetical protein